MEERKPISDAVTNPENAIEITNGSFAWDSAESLDNNKSNMNSSKDSKKKENAQTNKENLHENGVKINGKVNGKQIRKKRNRMRKKDRELASKESGHMIQDKTAEEEPRASDNRGSEDKVEVLHNIDLHISKVCLHL